MEDYLEIAWDVVTRNADLQYDQFKIRFEFRLKQTPLIANRMIEGSLLELSKNPTLQYPEGYTKEKLLEHLTIELSDYDERFFIVPDESKILQFCYGWKEFILNSRKRDYLNGLLSTQPTFEHNDFALAIKFLYEAKVYGEDSLEHAAFKQLAYSKFADEMQASGFKNPETNESTYRALRKLTTAYPGSKSGKTFASWAKEEYPNHYDTALKLIEKYWPDFDISRIPHDLTS